MKSLNDWILLDKHTCLPTPMMPAPSASGPERRARRHGTTTPTRASSFTWASGLASGLLGRSLYRTRILPDAGREAVIHDEQGGRLHLKPGISSSFRRFCRAVETPPLAASSM